MKVRIILTITVESERRYDRDGGQGYQQIRRWICGAIDTAKVEMWHIYKTVGKKFIFGMTSAAENKHGIRYAVRQGRR